MSNPLRRRPLATLALAIVIAACQPGPSASPAVGSPPTTQAPAGTPGAGSTTSPTGAPAASVGASLFDIDVAAAPFLEPADGPEGSLWPLPAAGTRAADGTLVLVVAWFGDGSTPASITIVTSTDGTTWDVGEHIFEGLAIGHPSPGPVPSAIVQLEDGTWQIYGWAAENASGSAFWSWRTSAPSLDGPWTLDATEMLPPGPAGDWDSHMAAAAGVQRTENGFLMWYEGEPPGSSNRGDIGLATSSDGLAWTKHDDPATTEPPFAGSDPVIATGACGAATSIAVEHPQVERAGDGYVALFGGYGADAEDMGVFGAVSDDGRTWRCGTPEPLLTGSALGGGDGIHTLASIPLEDGRIGLIAESLVSDHSDLWWATVELQPE